MTTKFLSDLWRNLQAFFTLRHGRVALPWFSVAILTSCAGHSPPSILPEPDEYRILPADVLEVSFADEPSLTQQVTVGWKGDVNLSFIASETKSGSLMAAGKTPTELVVGINRLAENNGFLIKPRSHVRILTYSEQTFVLYGQVTTPGRFPFPPGRPPRLELTEAIALGGGYTRLANPSKVSVKRKQELYRIDLRELTTRSGGTPFIVIPGDVITIPERIF